MNDIVWQLRARACPAGEPWTGDNPEEDHGHTDCWLYHQAADEIEQLRRWKAEATEILARWDSVADTIEIGPNQLGLHKSDLVAIELNDLRDRSENWEIDCKFDPSCDDAQMDREAADEIERLRSKLAQLESETDDLRRDLPA